MKSIRLCLPIIIFMFAFLRGRSQNIFNHPEILDGKIGHDREQVLKEIKFPFTAVDTLWTGDGVDSIKLIFKQNKLHAFLYLRSFDSNKLNDAELLFTRLQKSISDKYEFQSSFFDSAGTHPPFYMIKGIVGYSNKQSKRQQTVDIDLWWTYANRRYTLVMLCYAPNY